SSHYNAHDDAYNPWPLDTVGIMSALQPLLLISLLSILLRHTIALSDKADLCLPQSPPPASSLNNIAVPLLQQLFLLFLILESLLLHSLVIFGKRKSRIAFGILIREHLELDQFRVWDQLVGVRDANEVLRFGGGETA